MRAMYLIVREVDAILTSCEFVGRGSTRALGAVGSCLGLSVGAGGVGTSTLDSPTLVGFMNGLGAKHTCM